jgi:hypothetical protein
MRNARPVELACRRVEPSAEAAASRAFCLEQLLEAFRDIADRDDIHQAADRLCAVQAWIERETARAAADPIFSLSALLFLTIGLGN